MSDSYRCADAADTRLEPMLATASQVRGWVLVEVRGAWGEDAIHCSALAEHVPPDWKDQLKRRHVRVVCIRSHLRAQAEGVRLYACGVRRPGRGPAPLWTRDVDSLVEVVAAMDDLRLHREEARGWRQVDDKVVLVCTNGRHDQCCANRGRPVIRALRETRWADRLWECSHIGGDRFAANVVVLPDSIYFGRVEPDSALPLLEAFDDGRIDLARFRGRTSLSLAEQAVEHFVRRELGIDALDALAIEGRDEDGAFAVRVAERTARVRIRRRMVSVAEPLTCLGRPDQLVPSFSLVSIE
ncbi:MAG TPA: sucrase ferredoxin [Ilumatobacter sp.]|jgi:hypothetical protein|nr:sucrase ferredoxin [Ilumatobacter sp.]